MSETPQNSSAGAFSMLAVGAVLALSLEMEGESGLRSGAVWLVGVAISNVAVVVVEDEDWVCSLSSVLVRATVVRLSLGRKKGVCLREDAR